MKYLPNADNAVDLTVKPDFSQVESDTAQIATNQRFALFYPEKRPFFLEGIDMFATPLQAVYTRTITAPIAGGRVTGKAAGIRYTVLVADDDGGGSAILPGPNGSNVRAHRLRIDRVHRAGEAGHRPLVRQRPRDGSGASHRRRRSRTAA